MYYYLILQFSVPACFVKTQYCDATYLQVFYVACYRRLESLIQSLDRDAKQRRAAINFASMLVWDRLHVRSLYAKCACFVILDV